MTGSRPISLIISTVALGVMISLSTVVGAQDRFAERPRPNGPRPFDGGPPPPDAPPPDHPPGTSTITPPAIPTPTLAQNTFTDETGQFTTINGSTSAIQSNPFFQALGSNQRACVTCHRPSQGWSITPAAVRQLFNQSDGLDPLFRTVDGSDSPNAPVGTLSEREAAYSELLNRGLIRIGMPMPVGAQFTLADVDDPYNYASAVQLSLFRRPLPVTNLTFLSTVMYDGRFTTRDQTINEDVSEQAANAITTHEQSTVDPAVDQLSQIVAFETGNFTAQSFDIYAGMLTADGATAGPKALSNQSYESGINDPIGSSFNPNAMNIFDAWLDITNFSSGESDAQRSSIARGERLFNSRPFEISRVPGLNDVIGQPTVIGTCTTCHNTPNVGDHSLAVYIDLGLTDPQRTPQDLPLYTLKNNTTGEIRVTSDPGRALVTGRWRDIGKFKVPTLRGLAARAPYFHNGSAPSVNAVIGFYDRRFRIGLSPEQRTDLAAFLNSL